MNAEGRVTKPDLEKAWPADRVERRPVASLVIDYRGINTLVPYIRNARTHSDAQVAQIAASIKEFGFTNPILLDGESGIIAGHGRLAAARMLKMDEVPVIELAHLSKAQKQALILADNKLAMNAGWDDDLLKVELTGLGDMGFDLELTGFGLEEMALLFDEPTFAPGTEDDQGRLDQLAPKMVTCPHCSMEWDLREHGQG